MRRVNIAAPSTGREEWEALREPLESGWLTQGPKVREFEKAFALRHQVDIAIATTSCTTALHLALSAARIGPGDEVIVPAFTWVATANVVLHCGATPVLVDVDRETFNIDPAQIEPALTPRTKAVIPVHLFGLCADVPSIREIVGPQVFILEDAACASGARLGATPAGGLGDAAAFSFHPRKSITTGEGGMITTDEAEFGRVAAEMRNHGASLSEEDRHSGDRPFELPPFKELGFNYRMTDLQGAVGLVQLTKLDRFIEERQRWADLYRDELSGLSWLTPAPDTADGQHAWQSYVCYVDPDRAPLKRDAIMFSLEERGIATRPGTHAVHLLDYHRDRFGHRPEDFPNATACHENTLAIPLHNRLSGSDVEYVIDALRRL